MLLANLLTRNLRHLALAFVLRHQPAIERDSGKADHRHKVGRLQLLLSARMPITLVSAAPPRIAITSSDPAVLVFAPMPFRPSAKMVGNMMDMNRLVVSRQIVPTQPGCTTATSPEPR